MTTTIPPADRFLDAAGEACGAVTPLVRQALSQLESGQVLEVLTHDPSARVGIPAWCRLTGHHLLDSRPEDPLRTRFWLRKADRPTTPP